jgi:hypothetical protein
MLLQVNAASLKFISTIKKRNGVTDGHSSSFCNYPYYDITALRLLIIHSSL